MVVTHAVQVREEELKKYSSQGPLRDHLPLCHNIADYLRVCCVPKRTEEDDPNCSLNFRDLSGVVTNGDSESLLDRILLCRWHVHHHASCVVVLLLASGHRS